MFAGWKEKMFPISKRYPQFVRLLSLLIPVKFFHRISRV